MDLDHFFSRAARRAERTVAWVRATMAALCVVRLATLAGLDEPRSAAAAIALSACAAASIVLALIVCRARRVGPLLVAGVSLDTATVAACMLPALLAGGADYTGVLRLPETALVVLAVVASGVRLDRRVAVFSIALNAAFAGLLVAWDLARGISYGPSELTICGVVFLQGAAMAYVNASRVRQLVRRNGDNAIRAERARVRLGAYVSPEVADEALAAQVLGVGGSRREVAILFSDLRGFTRYGEGLPPEQLLNELNEYLDRMVCAIRSEGGVVDKFVGDSIMAVFGAFDGAETAAARAVAAARRMDAALALHNEERAQAGLPPLRHGIGVHYGAVAAGNIGNPDRMQYTVIGDAVNLASRLESASKDLDVPVVLSRAVVEAADLPPASIASLGTTRVKGRLAKVEVFTFSECRGDRFTSWCRRPASFVSTGC